MLAKTLVRISLPFKQFNGRLGRTRENLVQYDPLWRVNPLNPVERVICCTVCPHMIYPSQTSPNCAFHLRHVEGVMAKPLLLSWMSRGGFLVVFNAGLTHTFSRRREDRILDSGVFSIICCGGTRVWDRIYSRLKVI